MGAPTSPTSTASRGNTPRPSASRSRLARCVPPQSRKERFSAAPPALPAVPALESATGPRFADRSVPGRTLGGLRVGRHVGLEPGCSGLVPGGRQLIGDSGSARTGDTSSTNASHPGTLSKCGGPSPTRIPLLTGAPSNPRLPQDALGDAANEAQARARHNLRLAETRRGGRWMRGAATPGPLAAGHFSLESAHLGDRWPTLGYFAAESTRAAPDAHRPLPTGVSHGRGRNGRRWRAEHIELGMPAAID